MTTHWLFWPSSQITIQKAFAGRRKIGDAFVLASKTDRTLMMAACGAPTEQAAYLYPPGGLFGAGKHFADSRILLRNAFYQNRSKRHRRPQCLALEMQKESTSILQYVGEHLSPLLLQFLNSYRAIGNCNDAGMLPQPILEQMVSDLNFIIMGPAIPDPDARLIPKRQSHIGTAEA